MHLSVTDGKASLALAVILHEGDLEPCFSQAELDQRKMYLDENEVEYTVESVTWTDEQRQIIVGKIYQTADEARRDLSRPPKTFDDYKQIKIDTLSDIANGELTTFQSSALGTPHTYLIGQDSKGRDYMTLFSGEFSYITSSYYDPAKPIIWYTVEAGNIVHSKDEFAQVFLDARDHVGNVKYKLADLEAQISQAIDKPAVDAIVW